MAIADFLPHTFTTWVNGAMTISNSSGNGWQVADGNTGAGNGLLVSGVPHWWKIDLGVGASYLLDNYTMRAMQYATGSKTWTVSGSNNDADWDVIDTRTNITGWTAYMEKNFTCAVRTTGYRYFKINVTAVTSWTSLNELYLFGEAAAAEPQHYTLALGAGAFSLSGTPISVKFGGLVKMDPAVYSMVGKPLRSFHGYPPFVLEGGSFAMSGSALTPMFGNGRIRLDSGAFVMTGKPLDPFYSWYRGASSMNYKFAKQRREF